MLTGRWSTWCLNVKIWLKLPEGIHLAMDTWENITTQNFTHTPNGNIVIVSKGREKKGEWQLKLWCCGWFQTNLPFRCTYLLSTNWPVNMRKLSRQVLHSTCFAFFVWRRGFDIFRIIWFVHLSLWFPSGAILDIKLIKLTSSFSAFQKPPSSHRLGVFKS